jgi:hypothetical protein
MKFKIHTAIMSSQMNSLNLFYALQLLKLNA